MWRQYILTLVPFLALSLSKNRRQYILTPPYLIWLNRLYASSSTPSAQPPNVGYDGHVNTRIHQRKSYSLFSKFIGFTQTIGYYTLRVSSIPIDTLSLRSLSFLCHMSLLHLLSTLIIHMIIMALTSYAIVFCSGRSLWLLHCPPVILSCSFCCCC